MVYEKYIRRGGKVFGPYYYESYRENGKIKKRYLGTELSRKRRVTARFRHEIFAIIFVLIIIFGLFFLKPVGNAVLDFLRADSTSVDSVFLKHRLNQSNQTRSSPASSPTSTLTSSPTSSPTSSSTSSPTSSPT